VQRSSTSGRESLVAFTSVPFPQLLSLLVLNSYAKEGRAQVGGIPKPASA